MATVMRVSVLIKALESADKNQEMCAQILDNKLVLGRGLDPMLVVDFPTDTIVPYIDSRVGEEPLRPRSARRSGNRWFELLGRRFEHGSLHELLGEALRRLEVERPGTLEKLSHIKPKSKRIVSGDKKMLFESEHLSDKYGEHLVDGWWYGRNNSTQETLAWLQRACECAGLHWGKDFRMSIAGHG